MINKRREKIDMLKAIDRETVIMILFAVNILKEYFLDGTLVFITISDDMKFFSRVIDAVIYISILVFVCKGKYTKKEIIIIATGYLLILIVCLFTQEMGLLLFWTWLILAGTVPYHKWIKASLYCHCIGIATGIIATVAGIHQDIIGQYRSVLGIRYTFGLGQPNFAGNILFIIAASYCWLKTGKLRGKDYLLLSFITSIIYIFMNSLGTTIVMSAFIFAVFLFQNVLSYKRARRVGLTILFYISILCAVSAIILSIINVANIPLLSQIDRLISYRFTDAYRTFRIYGLSLFGQKIDFTELNTYVRLDGERNYYMDCMWIYLLSHYGIVFSGVFIYAYFSSMYRFVKKEEVMTVIIFFCGSLYAMEQRIWPFLFGWVFLVFLSESVFQNNLPNEYMTEKRGR